MLYAERRHRRGIRYRRIPIGIFLSLLVLCLQGIVLADDPLERVLSRAASDQEPVLVFVDRQKRRFPPRLRSLLPHLKTQKARRQFEQIHKAAEAYGDLDRYFLEAELEPGKEEDDAVLKRYDCTDYPALLMLDYTGEKLGEITILDLEPKAMRDLEKVKDRDLYLLLKRFGKRLRPFLQSNRMAVAESFVAEKRYDDARKVLEELQQIDMRSDVAAAARERLRWLDDLPGKLLKKAAEHVEHARVGEALEVLREVAEGFAWTHPGAREARLRLSMLQDSSLYRNWAIVYKQVVGQRLERATLAAEKGQFVRAIERFSELIREDFDKDLTSQAKVRMLEAVSKALDKAELELASGHRDEVAALCQAILEQEGLLRPVVIGKARLLLQKAQAPAP